jgi:hypothetical protein
MYVHNKLPADTSTVNFAVVTVTVSLQPHRVLSNLINVPVGHPCAPYDPKDPNAPR